MWSQVGRYGYHSYSIVQVVYVHLNKNMSKKNRNEKFAIVDKKEEHVGLEQSVCIVPNASHSAGPLGGGKDLRNCFLIR